MFEFKLPDLGEGIHEGELLKWHVAVGEVIEEDAPLVDVETDKAAVTIPSPKGGKVVSLVGSPGDTLEVGNVIATIDDGAGGGAAAAEPPAAPAKKEPQAAEAVAPAPPPPAAPAPAAPRPAAQAVRREGPVPAAPATRRLARELGVDLNSVPGSGPAGRVTKDDVRAFADGGASPVASTAASGAAGGAAFSDAPSGIPYFEVTQLPDFSQEGPVETEPVISIRRKVAKLVTTSMVMVPHVALMEDADITDLEAFRRRERDKRKDQPGGRLSMLPFVVKALTECLKEYPKFNASLDPHRGQIVYKKYYNIGIAADTPRGLLVPVVRDTDRKNILEISADIMDVATKAREGTIDVSELRGSTFSITNVGPLGGRQLIPTINYPEVAILAMGRAKQMPVVHGGEIVPRTILPLTLAFDHRVADGADAARFMAKLVKRLSDPLNWLLESR